MSNWFWNMYRFGRMGGWSIPKSIRMAWRARKGPDPKAIKAAIALHRASLPKDSPSTPLNKSP